jgi:hypothetical protein
MAGAVLIKREYSHAEPAVISVTMDVATPNGAELSVRAGRAAGPNSSFFVFEQRENKVVPEFFILNKSALCPVREALCTNPKGTISGNQEATDRTGREMLVFWWLPRDGMHSVEAKQSGLRSQPQITVGRLRDGVDFAFGESVTDFPGSVRVLVDVE